MTVPKDCVFSPITARSTVETRTRNSVKGTTTWSFTVWIGPSRENAPSGTTNGRRNFFWAGCIGNGKDKANGPAFAGPRLQIPGNPSAHERVVVHDEAPRSGGPHVGPRVRHFDEKVVLAVRNLRRVEIEAEARRLLLRIARVLERDVRAGEAELGVVHAAHRIDLRDAVDQDAHLHDGVEVQRPADDREHAPDELVVRRIVDRADRRRVESG